MTIDEAFLIGFVLRVGDIKAKQPESGDLCGNITEFGAQMK